MAAYAKTGTPVLTGELTVRYLRPAPAGAPLLVHARVASRKGRSLFIEGGIRLVASGDELTRAHGRFFLDATRSRDVAAAAEGPAAAAAPGAGPALANDPAEGET